MRTAALLSFLAAATASAEPTVVTVGVYLRNLDSIDFESNTYNLDFDLWMRWSGALQPSPPETFQFMNARDLWGLSIQPLYTGATGKSAPKLLSDGSQYQQFHVEGTFFHKFWLGTYPLDWQKFTIDVEDRLRARQELIYRPDTENSGVYSELQVPGWSVRDVENEERVAPSETSFGDPDRQAGSPISRYRFGVRLYRPARYFVLRLLPPLLMVFLTSVLIFLLPVSYVDSRLAVVSTGILSEIFLQLTYTQNLPSISISTINDLIYDLAYGLLLVAFAVCVMSGRWFQRLERLQRRLDAPDADPVGLQDVQFEADAVGRRLHRLSVGTALGMSLVMLLGTFAIIVTMRGVKDLIW
jgi:hypothetical protein